MWIERSVAFAERTGNDEERLEWPSAGQPEFEVLRTWPAAWEEHRVRDCEIADGHRPEERLRFRHHVPARAAPAVPSLLQIEQAMAVEQADREPPARHVQHLGERPRLVADEAQGRDRRAEIEVAIRERLSDRFGRPGPPRGA